MTSIPFSFPARLMGLVESSGLIRGDGPDLVVEYRNKYGCFFYGKPVVVRVPLAKIESVNLRRRWFGCSKLVVQANSISALDGLPEEQGRVEFQVAKRYRAAAEKFVERSYESGT